MSAAVARLLDRLCIDDPHFVEIESKRRVLPEKAKDLRDFLGRHKRVRHLKAVTFFDQFLDTPGMALFRRGASLRVRYKGNGSRVYLQYKGPGFRRRGLLYRSEFSTARLRHLVLEESHHDIVHFNEQTVQKLLCEHLPSEMARAMRRHLGERVLRRISQGPIICLYQKNKYSVDLGRAKLEPSLDQVFTFHVNKAGLHPLSSFCEYENEVKAKDENLETKLDCLPELIKFDAMLARRFKLPYERFDKYHRCGSFFMPNGHFRAHARARKK